MTILSWGAGIGEIVLHLGFLNSLTALLVSPISKKAITVTAHTGRRVDLEESYER